MATPTQIWFDPTHILKEGYLTKSPPLSEETIIRKRFRLRWFVLCYVGVEPTLYYFKDEKCRKQGKPKGRISLVGVEVFKQRSKVSGYPFVINIQTSDRLYHLCSTQQEIHEEWLEKLREVHIPNTEIRRLSSGSSCTCTHPLGQSKQPVSVNDIIMEHKQEPQNEQRHSSTDSRNSIINEDDEFDEEAPYDRPYSTKPSYAANKNNIYTKQSSSPTSSCVKGPSLSSTEKSRSLDFRRRSEDSVIDQLSYINMCGSPHHVLLEEKISNVLREEDDHGENEDTSYVTMDQTHSNKEIEENSNRNEVDGVEDISYVTMNESQKAVDVPVVTKKINMCESEDEGIGRSDSDSSGTSVFSNTRDFSKRLLEDAIRMSSVDDDFYNSSYVGPRLSISKQSKQMLRSRSLDDLLES